MSNLLVYSTTPNWRLTSDIRNTRLKDLEKEEIIVFKVIYDSLYQKSITNY